MAKTLVIADIHGCHQALLKLLDKISPEPADTIIFLGDYIDRGPDSRQVVETIIELKARFPRLITLMGNHERMLLDFLAGESREAYLSCGGRETLQSYGCNPAAAVCHIPAAHLHFFRELLLYWQDDNFIYVHAGLEPGVHLSRQRQTWLLWHRDDDSDTDHGKRLIHGHTVYPRPNITEYKTGIDTGAVYGGRLTCLVLPDFKFIDVGSEKFWPPA